MIVHVHGYRFVKFLQCFCTVKQKRYGSYLMIFEPRCEKTGLLGFQPGPTQTRLCNH